MSELRHCCGQRAAHAAVGVLADQTLCALARYQAVRFVVALAQRYANGKATGKGIGDARLQQRVAVRKSGEALVRAESPAAAGSEQHDAPGHAPGSAGGCGRVRPIPVGPKPG